MSFKSQRDSDISSLGSSDTIRIRNTFGR